MLNSNVAALGGEDGTAIVTCRCEDAEGDQMRARCDRRQAAYEVRA